MIVTTLLPAWLLFLRRQYQRKSSRRYLLSQRLRERICSDWQRVTAFWRETELKMKTSDISSSLQDYLEAILNLSRQTGLVRVTDIALELNLAKASVAQALTLLKEQGMIQQERYGPVELTEKGRRHALVVKHRHEILLGFLVEVLGVDRRTAEKDACLMEHAVSTETVEKLVDFLEERGLWFT